LGVWAAAGGGKHNAISRAESAESANDRR